jgi:hypothetical protein
VSGLSPLRRGTLIALIFLLLTPSGLWGSPARHVAVGDVHGDFNDFIALLQKIGLIDDAHHWRGGKATLIQLGDLVDRGPEPREVMDLLISLERESEEAGGNVVVLLGNHEVMNLMGDLRYVTTQNYRSFADAKSEERRRSAWKDYTKWRTSHAALLAELPPTFRLSEEEWLAQHPVGFLEQRDAFAPAGEYGSWIRRHAAVAKLDGIVYVHGGLNGSVAALGTDSINSQVEQEIRAFDSAKSYLSGRGLILPFFTLQEITAVVNAELKIEHPHSDSQGKSLQFAIPSFLHLSDWLIMRADSPLWFRGYDQWSDEEGIPQIKKVLQVSGAKFIVVGHTIQKNGRIRVRFGGEIYLIDTGMFHENAEGRASALEIDGDGETAAEYLDQRIVLQSGVAR